MRVITIRGRYFATPCLNATGGGNIMENIKVKRSIHIEYKYPPPEKEKTPATKNFAGTFVSVRASAYVSNKKPVLMQCICRDWKQYFQRSEDNGRTWKRCGEWDNDDGWYIPAVWDPDYNPSSAEKVKTTVKAAPTFFLDKDENLLLRIYSQCGTGMDSPFKDTMFEMILAYKIMYQISRDEGGTWSEPQQMIQQGSEYNDKHWGRDIVCGQQGGQIPGTPAIKLNNGEVCIPFCRTLARGKNLDIEAACFLGRWNRAKSGLDWNISEYVSLDQKLSAMGADEPCIAKMSDGRLFMILRAGGSGITNLPAFKYYSVSGDNGKTWSEAKVLTYPDGSVIYSPRCLAHAFCSSKNNRLYIITNILDHATRGCACDPRHPLQIAEVDRNNFCVIPETITIIEDRKPEQGEPDNIRFSNWQWHEDRETKDIVLYMTACPGKCYRPPNSGCPSHSYRYDIRLPEG